MACALLLLLCETVDCQDGSIKEGIFKVGKDVDKIQYAIDQVDQYS